MGIDGDELVGVVRRLVGGEAREGIVAGEALDDDDVVGVLEMAVRSVQVVVEGSHFWNRKVLLPKTTFRFFLSLSLSPRNQNVRGGAGMEVEEASSLFFFFVCVCYGLYLLLCKFGTRVTSHNNTI